MDGLFPDTAARQSWLSLLAKAPALRLAELMPPDLPAHEWLRRPEVGAVMVQGRTGATGSPFNLGEMTVTRCALRLADGTVGHGYVQGRDGAHATRMALVDALMQTARADCVRADVLAPLQAHATATAAARAAKAAATKVSFFTLARGED
jgi:alpha-D-ribose 1-methylphosphonate 5-triphosphate synthase subunit PhnG